jgi:rare lipoprotein A
MRGLIRWVLLVAATSLLAACADTRPAPSAEKRGSYKVGKPYQIAGVWYYPAEDYSYDETGIASWYGPNFHAKETANGEVFDQNAVTAAHKTLPLPCFVRVTNLENGRSIVVRVNDRGPYVASRIIDLSRRSAQLLGTEGQGTARVRVQILAEESRALAARLKAGERVDYAAVTPPPTAAPRERVAAETPASAPVPVRRQEVRPAVVEAPLPPPAAEPVLESQPVKVVAVKPTKVYIQAGAFQRYDNASKVIGKLQPYGAAAIVPVKVNGAEVYRVRMGPIGTVDEADKMLDRLINGGYPDARVVVD